MKCEFCREKLWELMEGTLPEKEAQQLRAHLAGCSACAEDAKMIQSLSKTLHDIPQEELPSGFHDELMLKLSREKEIRQEDTKEGSSLETERKVVPFPKKKKQSWRNFGLVAAAVVMVAVLGGTQGILRTRSAQDAVVQEMTKQADTNTTQEKTEEKALQADSAEAIPKESSEEEKVVVSQQTESSSRAAEPEKKAAGGAVQKTETVADDGFSGKEKQTENNLPAPQTANIAAGDAESAEELDIMPMIVSQTTEEQPGPRSAAPLWEDVTLSVADVPAAMEQVETIGAEMSLTEVEKTENSLTYAMAESQKKTFLERLTEVGSHSVEAAETDSQSEVLVKVTFDVQASE